MEKNAKRSRSRLPRTVRQEEMVGEAFIWLAPSSTLALVGAALTGLGYSLFTAALDGSGPSRAARKSWPRDGGLYRFSRSRARTRQHSAGLVASRAGLGAVFLASTLVVLCAAAIAKQIMSVHLTSTLARALRGQDPQPIGVAGDSTLGVGPPEILGVELDGLRPATGRHCRLRIYHPALGRSDGLSSAHLRPLRSPEQQAEVLRCAVQIASLLSWSVSSQHPE